MFTPDKYRLMWLLPRSKGRLVGGEVELPVEDLSPPGEIAEDLRRERVEAPTEELGHPGEDVHVLLQIGVFESKQEQTLFKDLRRI